MYLFYFDFMDSLVYYLLMANILKKILNSLWST